MANFHCKWVRDRLPLLVGEELLVADRRRVDRHLIDCPSCRQHRIALEQALQVLYAGATHSPSQTDAPSLWPDLARQIRQSRRPASSSPWNWSWSRFEIWPAIGLCASLALVVAIAVLGTARGKVADTRARMVVDTRPIAQPPVVVTEAPPAAQPESNLEATAPAEDATPLPEPVVTTRLGYDLDHGTPMGTDPLPPTRERKQQPTSY